MHSKHLLSASSFYFLLFRKEVSSTRVEVEEEHSTLIMYA